MMRNNEVTGRQLIDMAQYKVLLIDDDVELTALMSQYLSNNDFEVEVEHHGDKAVARIASAEPDLIVLDLMLPGEDGLSICRTVRDQFSGPIIMLTALSDEIDEVTGLEVGADDYLAKPVKPRVLLAHIRAQLRRYQRSDTQVEPNQEVILAGDLVIDAGKREVRKGEELIELTSAEFDLLWILAQNKGQVVSREALYQRIYRLEFDGLDRSVDLRISKLRKKIGTGASDSAHIKTVRSIGYQLTT